MGFSMKTAMASMVLLAVSASAVAGQINFEGEILDSACSLGASSVDQTISLGQTAKSVLASGGKSPVTTFNIDLIGCSLSGLTDNTVTATFTGGGSQAVLGALAVSGPSFDSFGIMLVDTSGTPIVLGTPTKTQVIQAGSNTLAFSAYLQSHATKAINPGAYTATTNFTLAYK